MNEQVEVVIMVNRKNNLYELPGVILGRHFLTPEEVGRLNAGTDTTVDKNGKYTELRPDYCGMALEVPFHCFRETDDMLTWVKPWCQPLRDLIAYPKIIPYLNTMLVRDWKLDEGPTIFTSTLGCSDLALHGSTNEIFNAARLHAYQYGHMRCGLVSFQYQLSNLNPGDGGLCLISHSHKANFPCAADLLTWPANQELTFQTVAEAGDLIIFDEATIHGTLHLQGRTG